MSVSLMKFFDDRGGEGSQHGAPLYWSQQSGNGLPFRGAVPPTLKGDEIDDLPVRLDARSRAFKLWVPEDKQAFDDIQDHVAAGLYFISKRMDRWKDEDECPTVWLEWLQCYNESPKPTMGTVI